MINEQAAQRTVLYVWVGWGVGWGVFYLMHAGKPVCVGGLFIRGRRVQGNSNRKYFCLHFILRPPPPILWISWQLAQGAVQKSISFQARLHLCSAFRSKDIFVHTYHPVRQEELERPQLHTHKRNHKSSHSKPPQNCVVFTSNTRILLSLPRQVYYQEKVCLVLWHRYVKEKTQK